MSLLSMMLKTIFYLVALQEKTPLRAVRTSGNTFIDPARQPRDIRMMSLRPNFDPFGEPVDDLATTPEGDRRARQAALAVFWTVALLLTAGRVYVGHIGSSDQVVAAAPIAIASAKP